MRGARKLGSLALVALLVCACACDTTQPTQLDEQIYDLRIRSSTATVPLYDLYDGFEDSDNDGTPDDTDGDGNPDFFLWCKNTTSSTRNVFALSVPYGYTIEVTILRNGEVVREQVTSGAALTDPLNSVSEYDDLIPNVPGIPPALSPITINGRIFKFQNPRRRSAANILVASTTSNPITSLDPGTYVVGNGLCSNVYYGPAGVDRFVSSTYPFSFVLGKGDSVTVKAIRAEEAFTGGVPIANPSAVSLSATLTTGGRPVEITGTTVTTPESNNSFAFTFRSF